MRLTPLFTAAVLVALLAGCTSAPDPTPGPSGAVPAPSFTEPARYGFVLDRKCGDGPSLGRYRVTVQDGEVVTADRIDGKLAAGEEEIDVPTLSGLLSLAQTAADDGGAVTAKVDPKDGHPTSVSVTVSDEDGPSCFLISDYAPLP